MQRSLIPPSPRGRGGRTPPDFLRRTYDFSPRSQAWLSYKKNPGGEPPGWRERKKEESNPSSACRHCVDDGADRQFFMIAKVLTIRKTGGLSLLERPSWKVYWPRVIFFGFSCRKKTRKRAPGWREKERRKGLTLPDVSRRMNKEQPAPCKVFYAGSV